jgi:hypothetical protein
MPGADLRAPLVGNAAFGRRGSGLYEEREAC